MPMTLLALTLAAAAQPAAAPPPAPMSRMARPDPDRVETRADYLAQAAARFDRIDINRDGRIDRAEREAMRDAMRDRRRARMGDGTPPPAPAPAY